MHEFNPSPSALEAGADARFRRAELLLIDATDRFEGSVQRVVALLQAGKVVALPTETVYGLAASAIHPEAVRKLFQIKGRPALNPIIVHIADWKMADRCCIHWPPVARRLAEAFWPGPLTLVLFRSAQIPDLVTGGGPTVGVRWPRHAFLEAVIRRCGFPLAAPSANLAGQLSPTTAQHVLEGLGDQIELIVDGGPCQVGIESTVVDVTKQPPGLLRPGIIPQAAIENIIGPLQSDPTIPDPILRSPGQVAKHYAPKAKLVIWSWENEAELRRRLIGEGKPWAAIQVLAHSHIPRGLGVGRVSVIPLAVEAYARGLYAELHRCDEAHAQLIVVEAPPVTPEWLAINDRLRRASA